MTIVVNSPVAGIGFAGAGGVSLVYPTILAQSAIPFILAGGTNVNQFTISATGALSALPTLPITSGNAFFYMPSGIPGLSAGWYYAQINSATTAQLYTATYTSGDPRLAVPASPTAPSGITAGSYSQTTGSAITAHQITLPGGSMGPNGTLRTQHWCMWRAVTTANSFAATFGGAFNNYWGNTQAVNDPNVGLMSLQISIVNVNSASRQYMPAYAGDTSINTNLAPTFYSVNTASDVTMTTQITLGNAAAYSIIHGLRYEVMYGA